MSFIPENALIANTVGDLIEASLRNKNYDMTFPGVNSSFFKTGNVSTLSGMINVTFGSPVYDWINRETNVHAIIRKSPWDRSGYRYTKSNPRTGAYGGADPGSIGTVITPTPNEAKTIPGFYHSPFDMTWDAMFRSRHDDGMDGWAWQMAAMRDIHGQQLNKSLILDVQQQAAGATGNTTDAKNDVTNSSYTTWVMGLESLDRAIASKAENDAVVAGARTGWYDLFEGDFDRDSTTDNDAIVCRPDGTQTGYTTTSSGNVTFQTKGLNFLIDKTEAKGAKPEDQLWLTTRESARKLYDEFEPQARSDMGTAEAKLDMQGLQVTGTSYGRDVTFTVRTYQGRPVVRDIYVPSSTMPGDDTGSSGPYSSEGAGRWYLLHQPDLDIQVGWPTMYVDADNPLYLGNFSTKAIYASAEQLTPRRFNRSGKVRNITV